MIKKILVEKLINHPNNPRLDLGDLTELADSIKANGVLQNLTVVSSGEAEERYIVVIGNRRLAAAKIAGLTEVPCMVVEMTEQEQIATMLLENIQREDLTIYEQAQGFQMMLDLGETVTSIAEKTGFSGTTIRRRVKLLELDQEKFKKSVERNVTLREYAELEKIESIELRNQVLEHIGTPNFNNEIKKAIEKEQSEKRFIKAIEVISTFATEIDSSEDLRYVYSYSLYQDVDISVPDDVETVKYYYRTFDYGSYKNITIYKEKEETEEDNAEQKERARQSARFEALNAIRKRTYELRREYAKSVSNTKAKKKIGMLIEYITLMFLDGWVYLKYEKLADIINTGLSESELADVWNDEMLIADIRKQPERYLFASVYCLLDSEHLRYYNYQCEYENDERLERVYDFLEAFGYELSDEEKAMRDGTHELFSDDWGRED